MSALGEVMVAPVGSSSRTSVRRSVVEYARLQRCAGAPATVGPVRPIGAVLTTKGSVRHADEHPSPSVVLPSSHCSSGLSVPSPHTPSPTMGMSVMRISCVSPAPMATRAQPVAMKVFGIIVTGSVPLPRTSTVYSPPGTCTSPRARELATSSVMSATASSSIPCSTSSGHGLTAPVVASHA